MGAERGKDREIRYTGLYMVTRFCITFLKRLARQIQIKNRSAEKLLAAMTTFIMFNIPLAKNLTKCFASFMIKWSICFLCPIVLIFLVLALEQRFGLFINP